MQESTIECNRWEHKEMVLCLEVYSFSVWRAMFRHRIFIEVNDLTSSMLLVSGRFGYFARRNAAQDIVGSQARVSFSTNLLYQFMQLGMICWHYSRCCLILLRNCRSCCALHHTGPPCDNRHVVDNDLQEWRGSLFEIEAWTSNLAFLKIWWTWDAIWHVTLTSVILAL